MAMEDSRCRSKHALVTSISIVSKESTDSRNHPVAAHTVIIHGTRHWAGEWEEYSDLDVMQMIGRAVRDYYCSGRMCANHGSNRDGHNSVFPTFFSVGSATI